MLSSLPSPRVLWYFLTTNLFTSSLYVLGGATLKFDVELMSASTMTTTDEVKPTTESDIDYKFLFKLVAIPSIIFYLIYSMTAKMFAEPDAKAKKTK